MRYCLAAFVLVFLVLFQPLCGNAQHVLQQAYTPAVREASIRRFVRELHRQTGISVSFSNAVVDARRKVSLKSEAHTVGELLEQLFAGLPVTLLERDNKVLVIPREQNTVTTRERQVTIGGYVTDKASKEVLIGATVYIPALNVGTTTNNYGFYSLSIPAGNHNLLAAYTGYKQALQPLAADRPVRYDVQLESAGSMEEVIVTKPKESAPDHAHLTVSDINSYAALLGDNDLLRALQHQPGVQSGNDGTVGLIVRGGDPGQNLYLLDGASLYYTDHFYGISSVFNTEALKSVDFYKDAFPARYGGRLSSVIDVSTKEGSMERIGGQVNIGILNGSLSLEGPVIKDKASVILTARRSWMDLFWRPFDNTVGLDFYDVNLKANYILNKTNRLHLSFYNGRDQFRITNDPVTMRTRWGNTSAAIKWTTTISPKLLLHTRASYSAFRYQLRDLVFDYQPDTSGFVPSFEGRSTIHERSIGTQLYWYASARHHMEAGLQYTNTSFSPASLLTGDGFLNPLQAGRDAKAFTVNEIVAYAEDNVRLSPRLQLRVGLRLANWLSEDFNYSSLQPRLYLSYKANERLQFYGSATRMAQFLHLLSNNTTGFPTDLWLPSTAAIKPETMLMGSVGAEAALHRKLSIGLELYYKDIQGLTTYRSGRNIFDNTAQWADKLTQGRGWSYGAEVAANLNTGPLSLALAYTLSWSFRQFDRLNGGDPFPYRYDRRHNLKIDAAYKFSRSVQAVAGWTYMTGEAITLPDQIYPDFDNNLLNGYGSSGYFTYNFATWNNYRLPAVHRLDVAVNFVRKRRKHQERTWTIGLFNVYGRNNIVGTSLVQEEQGEFRLQGYSLTRFIPTLSYRLKF